MISYAEALRLVAAAARPIGTERVTLADAHGRVLAAPIRARITSPATRVSTMDGYAVRRDDGSDLTVIGESLPGAPFSGTLQPGAAVRIFTGAAVPDGADWIVIQENARRNGDRVMIESRGEMSFIRAPGSDFEAGDLLAEPGTLLGPRALVAIAAADVGQVDVHRRPRLALLATGDELAEPGTAAAQPGRIPDSISAALCAFARDWGAEVTDIARLPDDLRALREAASRADADLIVVTGGASVGERDFAKAMFGDALALIFSKVRIKPGKPVWLGRAGHRLVMGLPGNPTSALVTARLLLAPLLAGMTGRPASDALRWRQAVLAEPLGPAGDRETFSRACWSGDRVRLLPNQDSGAQKTLALAELLVRRPAGVEGIAAGEPVEILDF
jgi:molybdopterin molybdotransferase